MDLLVPYGISDNYDETGKIGLICQINSSQASQALNPSLISPAQATQASLPSLVNLAQANQASLGLPAWPILFMQIRHLINIYPEYFVAWLIPIVGFDSLQCTSLQYSAVHNTTLQNVAVQHCGVHCTGP